MRTRLDRLPGGSGAGDLRLRIDLVGAHDIFRFCVNMLDDQVEFGQAGSLKLTALRKRMGRERFDPWALQMLGRDRYNRLCHAWGGRLAKASVETIRPRGGVL
jgi:hypothetical protein